MMCIRNSYICIVSVFILYLFSDCVNNGTETDKRVECRLCWISDSYPIEAESVEEDDFRMIILHYIIKNNTEKEYFLPIKKSISHDEVDATYCSEMIATIDKKQIDTWFSTDIRWHYILKPHDSIRANLKITEGRLENANVKKIIRLKDLLGDLELNYYKCLSDTIYSSHPIPLLYFTINDTIAIHYRDSIVKDSKEKFFTPEAVSLNKDKFKAESRERF